MNIAVLALSNINKLLVICARVVVIIQATIMLCSIVLQVFTRIAWNWSPPWTEEVALLMFGWIVLIMVAVGVREQIHVRIELLLELFPNKIIKVVDRIIFILIALVSCYLFWAGIDFVLEMRGSTSNAVRYPMELLYTAVPVTSVLMFLFALEGAVSDISSEKSNISMGSSS